MFKIDLRKLPGLEAQILLKEVLSYDANTGEFCWKKSRGGVRKNEIAGSFDKDEYIVISFCGFKYKAHRLAWLYMTGKWPKHTIDHKNLIRNDNRFENLRDVTMLIQSRDGNQREDCFSGKTGVCKHTRSNKWRARITVEGVTIHLGDFQNKKDAIQAREEAEDKYGFKRKDSKRKCLIRKKIQKGYDFQKRSGKWRARIHINGKEKYLGLFETKKEAIAARQEAEEHKQNTNKIQIKYNV